MGDTLSLWGLPTHRGRAPGEAPIPGLFPPPPFDPQSPLRMPLWCSTKGRLPGPAPTCLWLVTAVSGPGCSFLARPCQLGRPPSQTRTF